MDYPLCQAVPLQQEGQSVSIQDNQSWEQPDEGTRSPTAWCLCFSLLQVSGEVCEVHRAGQNQQLLKGCVCKCEQSFWGFFSWRWLPKANQSSGKLIQWHRDREPDMGVLRKENVTDSSGGADKASKNLLCAGQKLKPLKQHGCPAVERHSLLSCEGRAKLWSWRIFYF